jgi:hypothetical protein
MTLKNSRVVSIDALSFASDEYSVLTDIYNSLNNGGQLFFTTRTPLSDSPNLIDWVRLGVRR